MVVLGIGELTTVAKVLSPACVEGRVKAHGWLAPDGEGRVQLDITASAIQFLDGTRGSTREAEGGEGGIDINHYTKSGHESVEEAAAVAGQAVVTDDLPF